MQKSIRNSGKGPVSVESLDKRDQARNTRSANPVVKDFEKLDREREAVRIAQARAEKSVSSDNAQPVTEFDVQERNQ